MKGTLRHEGKIRMADPQPRALVRDARLSFGARGLFVFLDDLPEGWEVRLGHLAKMSPDGRDAIRSRMRELEAVGALRIEKIRGEGGLLAGQCWVLVAAHLWAQESPLNPMPDKGDTEKRIFRNSVSPKIDKADTKGFSEVDGFIKDNNNGTVLNFSDGTSLVDVPKDWAEDLREEVESQVAKTTKAALAKGILRHWVKAGMPSRSRPKPSYSPPVAPIQPEETRTPPTPAAKAAMDATRRRGKSARGGKS